MSFKCTLADTFAFSSYHTPGQKVITVNHLRVKSPNHKERSMTMPETDKVFAGSIPKLYQEHLVPMIFESYAVDLAQRLASSLSTKPNAKVLELAAGTGALTRHLAALLPAGTSITATDLNPAMLAIALHIGTPRAVTWEQADALKLPFADGSFDAVVCQFGVMFFPDKSKAFSEARRVLKPGGVLLFNVWDKLDENEFPDTVNKALAALYPSNPSHFMARAPHGYFDQAHHCAGFENRRLHRPTPVHHPHRPQPRRLSPHPRCRLLPRHAHAR